MRQRGRRSAAALVTLPPDSTPQNRLEPPADLLDVERELFTRLINTCHPTHFVESDTPLLVSFVQATLLARETANKPPKVAVWEKAVKVQAMLATRLRLAPQARMDPKSLARKQKQWTGRNPWEI
jgi:hypothetical protein